MVAVGVVVVSFIVPVAIDKAVDDSDDVSNFDNLSGVGDGEANNGVVKQPCLTRMVLSNSLSLTHWVMLTLQNPIGGVPETVSCVLWPRRSIPWCSSILHSILFSC